MAVVERIPNDCPKCGGDVVMIDYASTGDDFFDAGTRFYSVVCPKCMFGAAPNCPSREEALHSWENTKEIVRAEMDLRRNKG